MSWRHQLRLTAADTLSSVLPYTSYLFDEAEYLGTIDEPVSVVRERLRNRGYHYQLFGATKQHPERDQIDSGSYARIPRRHPDAAEGTALDTLDPRECQYHVHPFGDGDTTELYGHYEIHPYPWTPCWDLTRPYPRHYRPTWDRPDTPRSEWTYLRGVTDPRLTPLL
jgi:hypothetical protein